jgi:hypothetical protein
MPKKINQSQAQKPPPVPKKVARRVFGRGQKIAKQFYDSYVAKLLHLRPQVQRTRRYLQVSDLFNLLSKEPSRIKMKSKHSYLYPDALGEKFSQAYHDPDKVKDVQESIVKYFNAFFFSTANPGIDLTKLPGEGVFIGKVDLLLDALKEALRRLLPHLPPMLPPALPPEYHHPPIAAMHHMHPPHASVVALRQDPSSSVSDWKALHPRMPQEGDIHSQVAPSLSFTMYQTFPSRSDTGVHPSSSFDNSPISMLPPLGWPPEQQQQRSIPSSPNISRQIYPQQTARTEIFTDSLNLFAPIPTLSQDDPQATTSDHSLDLEGYESDFIDHDFQYFGDL